MKIYCSKYNFSFQTFIVRKSSQPNTMAISVRLPSAVSDKGHIFLQPEGNMGVEVSKSPYQNPRKCPNFVQHYLIEQYHPENDSNKVPDAILTNDDAAIQKTTSKSPKTKMKLESSHNTFDNILSLVYHYLTVK